MSRISRFFEAVGAWSLIISETFRRGPRAMLHDLNTLMRALDNNRPRSVGEIEAHVEECMRCAEAAFRQSEEATRVGAEWLQRAEEHARLGEEMRKAYPRLQPLITKIGGPQLPLH